MQLAQNDLGNGRWFEAAVICHWNHYCLEFNFVVYIYIFVVSSVIDGPEDDACVRLYDLRKSSISWNPARLCECPTVARQTTEYIIWVTLFFNTTRSANCLYCPSQCCLRHSWSHFCPKLNLLALTFTLTINVNIPRINRLINSRWN